MDFEAHFKVHSLVSVNVHHTKSNDQSQHNVSCGGVSLSTVSC